MWLLAIVVAIVGTALLQSAGSIDTAKTIYTSAHVPWLSHIVGGFCWANCGANSTRGTEGRPIACSLFNHKFRRCLRGSDPSMG